MNINNSKLIISNTIYMIIYIYIYIYINLSITLPLTGGALDYLIRGIHFIAYH